jgi:CelD/BcsL family acetyltransferase involved in cellulose biosynthesis
MIKFVPGEYSQVEWGQLAERAESQNLMQCWAYGEAKKNTGGWRVERGVFTDGDVIVGIAQAMIRNLPGIGSLVGGGLCWVNRGPLLFSDLDTRIRNNCAADLLEALRQYYVVDRSFYLRIALPDRAPEKEQPNSAPAGFRLTGSAGWASALLTLAPGADDLRTGLRPNWRNKLGKAERGGLRVQKAVDAASLLDFVDEYRNFLTARGFTTTVTPDLLRALFQAAALDGTATCYRAISGDTPLGSIATIRYGETVEYLAATTLEAARSVPVGQALVWRAICDACDAGAGYFDVSGMDPDTTPKGIFEFKSGLNGDSYRLCGEIESVGGGLRAALVRWQVERAKRQAL